MTPVLSVQQELHSFAQELNGHLTSRTHCYCSFVCGSRLRRPTTHQQALLVSNGVIIVCVLTDAQIFVSARFINSDPTANAFS